MTSTMIEAEKSFPLTVQARDPGRLTTPAPLHPKQIISGTPEAHIADAYHSPDGSFYVSFWSCTTGKFTWSYRDVNEAITILEGEAFVTTSDGIEHHLVPGVSMAFGKGEIATWHVPSYIRKMAIVHLTPRSFSRKVVDKLRKEIGARLPAKIKARLRSMWSQRD